MCYTHFRPEQVGVCACTREFRGLYSIWRKPSHVNARACKAHWANTTWWDCTDSQLNPILPHCNRELSIKQLPYEVQTGIKKTWTCNLLDAAAQVRITRSNLKRLQNTADAPFSFLSFFCLRPPPPPPPLFFSFSFKLSPSLPLLHSPRYVFGRIPSRFSPCRAGFHCRPPPPPPPPPQNCSMCTTLMERPVLGFCPDNSRVPVELYQLLLCGERERERERRERGEREREREHSNCNSLRDMAG